LLVLKQLSSRQFAVGFFISALVFGFTCLPLQSNSAYAQSYDEQIRVRVVEQLKKSVFTVRTVRSEEDDILFAPDSGLAEFQKFFDGRNTNRSPYRDIGNGFCIDGENGYVLTASFVVSDELVTELVDPDGTVHEVSPKWISEETDLALLEHPGGMCEPLKWALDTLKIGSNVHVFGNFESLGSIYQPRIVSGFTYAGDKFDRYAEETQIIYTDRGFNKGSAGAPLVDNAGNVVGLVVASYGRPAQPIEHIGLSVGAESLEAVFTQNMSKYQKP